MELPGDIGDTPIIDVIKKHPKIGEILSDFEIGCIECSIGTCLFKEVVKIHFLGDEVERQIEKKIKEYLSTL